MALAGLWENWRSPAGEWVRSFAIVTTTPNELCAGLHNRMPVVLAPETWPAWLGEEPADPPQLKALLAPYPSAEMTCWPVSARVGNVKNNDPSLIEPLTAGGWALTSTWSAADYPEPSYCRDASGGRVNPAISTQSPLRRQSCRRSPAMCLSRSSRRHELWL